MSIAIDFEVDRINGDYDDFEFDRINDDFQFDRFDDGFTSTTPTTRRQVGGFPEALVRWYMPAR